MKILALSPLATLVLALTLLAAIQAQPIFIGPGGFPEIMPIREDSSNSRAYARENAEQPKVSRQFPAPSNSLNRNEEYMENDGPQFSSNNLRSPTAKTNKPMNFKPQAISKMIVREDEGNSGIGSILILEARGDDDEPTKKSENLLANGGFLPQGINPFTQPFMSPFGRPSLGGSFYGPSMGTPFGSFFPPVMKMSTGPMGFFKSMQPAQRAQPVQVPSVTVEQIPYAGPAPLPTPPAEHGKGLLIRPQAAKVPDPALVNLIRERDALNNQIKTLKEKQSQAEEAQSQAEETQGQAEEAQSQAEETQGQAEEAQSQAPQTDQANTAASQQGNSDYKAAPEDVPMVEEASNMQMEKEVPKVLTEKPKKENMGGFFSALAAFFRGWTNGKQGLPPNGEQPK